MRPPSGAAAHASGLCDSEGGKAAGTDSSCCGLSSSTACASQRGCSQPVLASVSPACGSGLKSYASPHMEQPQWSTLPASR
eukprot:scaffold266534_cov32-Tisochrysis_lutea.AAC.3